nr:MAG TPA: DNA repair protein MmcB-like protein [Caudoviricetes sp.]
MSKTKQTRLIEEKLDNWKPSKLANFKPSYMRTQVGIHECTVTHGDTKSGIVDYVWIADGFANERSIHKCTLLSNIDYVSPQFKCNRHPKDDFNTLKCYTELGVVESVCNNCVMKCRTVERDIAHYIICFEIKVTVNDFYSKNGHNFVGDLNYYVMLPTVYEVVKDDIPENVGVILANISKEDTVTFKIKKDSTLTTITEEDRNWFLQTALSRESKKYKELEQLHRSGTRDLKYNAYNMCYDIFMSKLKEIEKPSCFICRGTNFCNQDNKVDKCDECMQNYLYFNNIVRETLDKYHLTD